MRRFRARLVDERGVSLVELLVVMMFTGVIGTIMLTTLSTSTRAYGQVDDESRGLSDLQTVVERLGRDLRAARGVEAPADATQLTIWIDDNSDYVRSPGEIFTWRIRTGAEPGQFDVVRIDDLGVEQVIGYSLVSNIAFSYPGVSTPSDADVVRVSMEYDAITEAYATDRTATFEIRLRNAP